MSGAEKLERQREAVRRYRKRNREKIRAQQRKHKKELYALPEKKKEIQERNKAAHKNWTEERRKEVSLSIKSWRATNKEKTRLYRIKANELNRTDPYRRLVRRLRSRIRSAFFWSKTREFKSGSTMELVGASKQELLEHIESQFKPGMSWENMGLWHVDHKKPCALFDLSDPIQQKECFHFTNLQPLWAADNLAKATKFPLQEGAL